MSRKNGITVVSVVLFSFMIVVVLYTISDKPLKYAQGFVRNFGRVRVYQENTLDLKSHGYYLAGITSNEVFLANQEKPLDLLITSTQLRGLKQVRLNVYNDKKMSLLNVSQPMMLGETKKEEVDLRGSFLEIDSPFFYIKAGGLPGIFKGWMGQWHAVRIADSVPFFYNAISLGKDSFAFMAIGTTNGSPNNKNILCKVSNGSKVKLNTEILEGQADSFFSTKGMLRYSKKLNRLVYTYDYRNQYIVIDTALALQYRGNTIDTISRAHIKPIEIEKNRVYSLASTPAIVNENVQIYGDLLFVQSNMMASNETRKVFDQTSVIDIYDLSTNIYQASFYLPHHGSIKMTTFKVFENRIVALYDDYLISYIINM